MAEKEGNRAGPQCVPRIYITHTLPILLRNCPPRLRRPCSSSTSRSCVSQEERGIVETVKSVLGLEETARQLLFLHSSKSSLESNLPVCYCIQTTPATPALPLSTLPRARVSFTVAAGLSTLSRREHTQVATYTRAHTAQTQIRARTLSPRFIPLPRTGTHEFCMHTSCLAFR